MNLVTDQLSKWAHRISLCFIPYDFVLGVRWDKRNRALFLHLLPTISIKVQFQHPASVGAHLKRMLHVSHSIRCAGYRGWDKVHDLAACDCGAKELSQ